MSGQIQTGLKQLQEQVGDMQQQIAKAAEVQAEHAKEQASQMKQLRKLCKATMRAAKEQNWHSMQLHIGQRPGPMPTRRADAAGQRDEAEEDQADEDNQVHASDEDEHGDNQVPLPAAKQVWTKQQRDRCQNYQSNGDPAGDLGQFIRRDVLLPDDASDGTAYLWVAYVGDNGEELVMRVEQYLYGAGLDAAAMRAEIAKEVSDVEVRAEMQSLVGLFQLLLTNPPETSEDLESSSAQPLASLKAVSTCNCSCNCVATMLTPLAQTRSCG
jgi:hypothetical protein